MPVPTTFEDRLLAELRAVVADRPAPDPAPVRGRRVLRPAIAGGVAAVAAVVGVLALTGGGEDSTAYAVDRHGDGSVTVHVKSLEDAAGLQRELRAAGVPAIVDYEAAKTPCGALPPTPAQGAGGPSTSVAPDDGGKAPSVQRAGTPGTGAPTTSSIRTDQDGVTFTIDPATVPDGEHVYLTTSTGAVTSVAMSVGSANPAPPCGEDEGNRP